VLLGIVAGAYFFFAAIQNSMFSAGPETTRDAFEVSAILFAIIALVVCAGGIGFGAYLFVRSSRLDDPD